jgi:hypothetical protein
MEDRRLGDQSINGEHVGKILCGTSAQPPQPTQAVRITCTRMLLPPRNQGLLPRRLR